MVLHIFLAIILSFRIYAGDTVAEVILVKGQVTKLYPGTLKALEVKLGDKLPEDTSLATAERSIVRVKYSDGSQVTIGPKGHVNLVMASKKGSGLISLLKGKIRSQVMKNGDSQKTKLIIKTRNAALGVRGTDFQTVYNPANKNTSLVTFDGEVAMKKVSDKEILKKSIETSTTPTKAPVQNFEDYDKIIDKNNVLVKKGRFSGVSQQATQATNPIKINPKQYVALKKSNEFNISKKPIEIT
ncbi:MAG: FecR domain-containing protein, partial [Halobacteriovoraceae bacterium]|nr:FecR domain-containing protein [Halobacteriovoraceae bacterium]